MTDREAYARYINSAAWAAKRRKYIATTKGRCVGCMSTKGLHVHHLTYERFGNERMGDLKLVCQDCHTLIHQTHNDLGGSLRDVSMSVLEWVRASRQKARHAASTGHKRPSVKDWRDEVRRPSWVVMRAN